MNTTRSRRCNALRLALFSILTLALRHKAEDLEHQVCDERAHEVFTVPGVQKRHVDYADINADILGQYAPLTLNLFIVPAQPFDAEDIGQITGFQLFQHLFVLRTVKVLSGLFVDEGLLGSNELLPQGDQLAILVLILTGNAHIAIGGRHHFSLRVLIADSKSRAY